MYSLLIQRLWVWFTVFPRNFFQRSLDVADVNALLTASWLCSLSSTSLCMFGYLYDKLLLFFYAKMKYDDCKTIVLFFSWFHLCRKTSTFLRFQMFLTNSKTFENFNFVFVFGFWWLSGWIRHPKNKMSGVRFRPVCPLFEVMVVDIFTIDLL